MSNLHMMSTRSKREDTLKFLDEVEKIIRREGLRSLIKLDHVVKGRVKKALEMLTISTIVRVKCSGRTLWFYVGPHSVHYIIPRTYCTCVDFNMNVIFRGRVCSCYHLILQVICECMGRVVEIELNPDVVEKVMEEVEDSENSRTLRTIIIKHRTLKGKS